MWKIFPLVKTLDDQMRPPPVDVMATLIIQAYWAGKMLARRVPCLPTMQNTSYQFRQAARSLFLCGLFRRKIPAKLYCVFFF